MNSLKNEAKLTLTELKRLLHYDPDKGIFTRLVRTGNTKVGDEVGGSDQGYSRISINGVRHQAHRLAFLYIHGRWPLPGLQLGHINGVRDDNRIVNLREVTNIENSRNARVSMANTTGYPGVSYNKQTKLYRAALQLVGRVFLGTHKDPKRAHLHYRVAIIRYKFDITHGLTKDHGLNMLTPKISTNLSIQLRFERPELK